MFKCFLPRTLQQGTPRIARRLVRCQSNQMLIDLIIGVIAIGVISDVGSTLLKKKRNEKEQAREIVEPIVMDEEDEEIIDIELE